MGLAVFTLFVICGTYMQRCGGVQHENLNRKFTGHSNLFGSINCLFTVSPKSQTGPMATKSVLKKKSFSSIYREGVLLITA